MKAPHCRLVTLPRVAHTGKLGVPQPSERRAQFYTWRSGAAALIPPRLNGRKAFSAQLPQGRPQPARGLLEQLGRRLAKGHPDVARHAAGGAGDDSHLVHVHQPGHHRAVIVAACGRGIRDEFQG